VNTPVVLLSKLNIDVEVIGREKIEQGSQYLIVSNHRSIIDPLVIEIALKDKDVHGLWIAKKELFNSFFFGTFTRNSGSILLDRESSQMGSSPRATQSVYFPKVRATSWIRHWLNLKKVLKSSR
jgi:1-acyl-sn-glycerol-3-phosphate acyltransferase